MTLKIETQVDDDGNILRLAGCLNAENLSELAPLVDDQAQPLVLDLKQISLVDVNAIQFLARCERAGVALRNCPPYVKSWIAQEQNRDPETKG